LKGIMMETLLRHWRTLQMIPPYRRNPISSTELQAKLEMEGYEVHLRTLQRDLHKLSQIFPIVCKEGKPLSWSWSADAETFDVPGMDSTAALTFRMVDLFLSKMLPASCRDALSGHMKRAETILDDLDSKGYGAWPKKIKVVTRTQPLLPPEINPQIFDVINEALLRDLKFKGFYRGKGSTESQEYVVNPLGLVIADPVIYLVGTLWQYDSTKDVLLLALHRFQSAELIEETALRPSAFDLDTYINSGALQFPVEAEKTIKLKAMFDKGAAGHLYESPLSANQELTEIDDDVLLQAEVLDTSQLRWWLLGFGSAVEVLAPKSLRKEFAQISKDMSSFYNEE